MPDYQFQKQIRVTYPECDFCNQMKLSSIMRHGQEASAEHLEAIGLTQPLLWQEGFVYLLTRVSMQISRLPGAMETVGLLTQPCGVRGVYSLREIWLSDAQGRELVYAQTSWVLVHPEGHRVRRPAELQHRIPLPPNASPCTLVKGKRKRPEGIEKIGLRPVRFTDIDCNMHVNNAVYADIVCDFLPFEELKRSSIACFDIAFIGEALPDGELCVLRKQLGQNEWYVGANLSNGLPCFDAFVTTKPRTGQDAASK